jgi:excisionase family DNA binding protein
MKAELLMSPDFVNEIVERLFEKIKPVLSGNGKSQESDIIYDVKSLAEYLKVSHKWIYERVQFKEITYLKVNGILRFRKKEIDKWLQTYNVPHNNKK